MDRSRNSPVYTPGSHPQQETQFETESFPEDLDQNEDVSAEEASDDEEESLFRPTLSRRERVEIPQSPATAHGDIIEIADSETDSEGDVEWEESLSMYYLGRDEAETSWRRRRPRLPSLLRAPRESTPPPPAPIVIDEMRFVYVPGGTGERRDELSSEDEDYDVVEEESADWVVPLGDIPQEDYTWDQLHPTASRALSLASSLPYVEQARQIVSRSLERAQPYFAAARETYGTTAAHITTAARAGREIAIISGQVGGWLLGEARQAVVRLDLPGEARLAMLLLEPVGQRLREHARRRVGEGVRVARVLLREYMAAVEPLPMPPLVFPDQRQRRRRLR